MKWTLSKVEATVEVFHDGDEESSQTLTIDLTNDASKDQDFLDGLDVVVKAKVDET